MKYNESQLWDNFKTSLIESINETPVDIIGKAWESN
jgi:hypothetical protein